MLKTAWLIGFLMVTWDYIGYPLCKRRFEGRKGRRLFGALALGAMAYKLVELETVAMQQALDIGILLSLAFAFVFDALEGGKGEQGVSS